MKFHYDVTGAQLMYKKFPLYGAGTVIPEGAVVMRGATAGTNQGFGIIGTSTLPGVLGVTAQQDPIVVSGSDSKADGTAYTRYKVMINPFAVFLAQHDAGALAISSVSGVTVTFSSYEASVQGSWLLGSDGQLQYVASTGSNTALTKTATGWTGGVQTVTKIEGIFWAVTDFNTAGQNIKNPAAAPTGKVRVVENYIKAFGIPFQIMDPTKHSGLTLTNPVAYSDVLFTDHFLGING